MKDHKQPVGMNAFLIVWGGQVASLMGTGMTRFAVIFWAWQITGEATSLALVGFFSFGPLVLFSPLAGALVDRWNRKLVMMISDLAAGLSTIVLLLLFFTDTLEIWHLYVAGAFSGAFGAFQFPAYSATVTTMLPKTQYARASGLLSLAQSISDIGAPILAGILLGVIGLGGIMLIDVATFLVAIGSLLLVYIPQPDISEVGRQSQGSLWSESLFGFRYIFGRPSLLGLQLIFFTGNFVATLSFILFPALILARTQNNELILGTVQSMMGVGGLMGSLLLSAWGGPKRKVNGILVGWAATGLLGTLLMGLGPTVLIWAIGAFFGQFFVPIINGSNQAIWQIKVPPDVQGRVFSARMLIASIASPVAMLTAGPLVDHFFEPAMTTDTTLATLFGGMVGTTMGSGIALVFVFSGLLTLITGLGGFFFRVIRDAEIILPDFDHVPETAAVADTIV